MGRPVGEGGSSTAGSGRSAEDTHLCRNVMCGKQPRLALLAVRILCSGLYWEERPEKAREKRKRQNQKENVSEKWSSWVDPKRDRRGIHQTYIYKSCMMAGKVVSDPSETKEEEISLQNTVVLKILLKAG